MSSELRTVRETVTATLTALALSGVTVYGYELPTLPNGASVTVSTAGFEATEWLLAIRIYVNGMQPGDAQNLLDDTAVAIDLALDAPRSEWESGYDDDRQVLIASTTIQVGRQDF